MPLQRRNDELVSLLSADFQRRHESNFAWKSACSAFLALPYLRGFWPMGTQVGSSAADIACGYHLTISGTPLPTFDQDGLVPHVTLDATSSQSFYYADNAQFDILGTEAYIASAARGLTLGGWFKVPQHEATSRGFIGKWNATGDQRSYLLRHRTTPDAPRFLVSLDGGSVNTSYVDSTASFSVPTSWFFLAGRFDPSTSVDIWVNDVQDTNTTSIIASAFNSTSLFYVGAEGPAGVITADASMCFLCAGALTDVTIWSLYQQTRALFGV